MLAGVARGQRCSRTVRFDTPRHPPHKPGKRNEKTVKRQKLVLQKSKIKWPHALSNPRPSRSVLTNDSDHGFSKHNIANTHPQVNNLKGTENVSAGINEIPSSSSSYTSALTDGKKIRNSSRNHSTFSQAINLRRGEKVSTMFVKKNPLSPLTISSENADEISSDTISTHRQVNNPEGGENVSESFAQGKAATEESSPDDTNAASNIDGEPVSKLSDTTSTNLQHNNLEGGKSVSEICANIASNSNPDLPGEENFARDIEDELQDPVDKSPAAHAKAVAISAAAFARLATAHHTYMRETTAERLNMHGVPATFVVGDKVKIYVPPTHNQLKATGRRAKHIVAWRGPCTITVVLSRTSYEMTEDCSDRVFQRTLSNIRPYRATRDAPPPHHDPFSNEPLAIGHLIALTDDPGGRFRLAKVMRVDEASATIHYFGTQNPDLARATFRPVWTRASDDSIALRPTRPQGYSPWLGVLDIDDLHEAIIASNLGLTSGLRLKRDSVKPLFHLRERLVVH